MRLIFKIVALLFGLIVGLVELLFWIFSLTSSATTKVGDAAASWRVHGNGIRCPLGHAVPTDDIACECTACGYRYIGSLWRCENVECGATTVHATCPTCGLSIRNPWRWGRP